MRFPLRTVGALPRSPWGVMPIRQTAYHQAPPHPANSASRRNSMVGIDLWHGPPKFSAAIDQ